MDFLKVIVLSIVEGVTEFLPVSSTGHLILVNELIRLKPESFANAFNIIIQLGAILSVVVVFFHRLNPFSAKKVKTPARYNEWNKQTRAYWLLKNGDKRTLSLWGKVIVGVIPAAVLGLLFDDFIDEHLMNHWVVMTTLLVYGIIIVWLESTKRGRPRFATTDEIDLKTAFLIGMFQCLALVPGTSRSAATIIGAMLLGTSRYAAAEFSFFLAIPTMIGATLLKVIKNIGGFTAYQWLLILLGFVLSFIVAYVVIRKFLSYVQNRDFKVFGYYRIALALVLFVAFLFIK